MTTTQAVSTAVTDLPQLAGATYGPSAWRPVTQEEVDLFAKVTGDHNPIHIDPEAAAKTPYGRTIAHGLLTLSLVVPMMDEVFTVTGASMGINYGLNKVRFPAPVPVGSNVRVHGVVDEVGEIPGGYQLLTTVTWDIEGGERPVCVAQLVLRYYA
jgi:acyl dehydratase